jgi:3-hydroxyisobutyrate dehydrogenase
VPLQVGFIGLGNIGKPMARRLVDAGLPTRVFDLVETAVAELVAAGAMAAKSPREVAQRCEVIGVCVRDDADVREVMLGRDGICVGATPGLTVAIHSTILPRTLLDVAKRAGEQGVAVIDACITGGANGAAQGTLTYIVGGPESELEKCRPMFAASAARIVHTGELGSGMATKLCNNLMTYLGFLAAYEATTLARASGLSEKALEEVTRANGNLTDQMLAFLALHRLPADAWRDQRFRSLVRGFATLAEKDLDITLAFASENGIELPGTARCRELIARVYGVETPSGQGLTTTTR